MSDEDRPAAEDPGTPVTPRRAFTALALVLLGVVVVVGGYLGALKLTGRPAPGLPGIVLLLTVATAAPVAVLLVMVRRGGPSWRQLGFVRPGRRLLHVLWQAPLGILGSGLVAAAVLTLATGAPRRSSATDSLEGLASTSPVVLGLALVLVVVVTPLWEETLFRGLVYAGFLRRWGPAGAVLGSAAVFAVFHVVPALWAYLLPFGLFLGWVRWHHRTIWASVAAHALNNALTMVALLAAT